MIGKLSDEVLIVIPTHAAAAAAHQTAAAQNKAAGAQTDQRHTDGRRITQVLRGGLIDLRAAMQQSAHHHDIVEPGRIEQRCGRSNRDATAGTQRLGAARHR